jgi:hypothetical protein
MPDEFDLDPDQFEEGSIVEYTEDGPDGDDPEVIIYEPEVVEDFDEPIPSQANLRTQSRRVHADFRFIEGFDESF